MTGNDRRKKIISILTSAPEPIPGNKLSEQLKVSRQIIVQDIALLRSAGYAITSTNRGYTLGGQAQAGRLIKVKHSKDQIRDEMQAIVDLGGCITEIAINHRTYGMISAPMDIKSRRDINHFLDELDSGISEPLSSLTNGYHFHHVTAESEEILDEIEQALNELGFIADLSEYEKKYR